MRRSGMWLMVGLAVALAGCASGPSGSAPPAAKLVTPPLPAGWQVVSVLYVGVDVPGSWTVEHWKPTCGVQTPTAYLGPQGMLPKCTTKAPGAEVDVGAYAYLGSLSAKTEHVNGLTLRVVSTQVAVPSVPGATATEMWVSIKAPRPLGLYFYVGDSTALPGGGPGLAQQILATVHESG